KNPDQDTYVVVARSPVRQLGALRLAALPDPRPPRRGPGRSAGNGNFLLSAIHLDVGPARDGARPIPARFARAGADLSRATEPYSGHRFKGVQGIINGEPGTCWSIWPQVGKAHRAIFQTREPIPVHPDSRLTVTLEFRPARWKQHALGRFRLAVSDR